MSNIDLPEELNKVIKNYRGDNNQKIIKGGLSAIPFLGGVFAEFIRDPFEQRLIYFLSLVVQDMNKIKEKFGDLDGVLNKNEFTTTLMDTIQIATRNHQEEKLKALRTILLNSQLENDVNFDVRFMFIRLVDEFTPTHLTLLDFIDNPRKWFENKNIDIDSIMTEYRANMHGLNFILSEMFTRERINFMKNIFPNIEESFYFYNQVFQDLSTKGLVNDIIRDNTYEMDSYPPFFELTKLGIDFKKFVLTPPIELDKLHDSAGKGEF